MFRNQEPDRGMETLLRRHLAVVEAPPEIWTTIEAALEEAPSSKPSPTFVWRWVFAAVAAVALVSIASWSVLHRTGTRWEVVRLGGAVGHISAGEWLETDSASSATIKVGDIGSVDVAPKTRSTRRSPRLRGCFSSTQLREPPWILAASTI